MKIIIHNKLLEFFFAKANDRVCIFKHCLLNKGVSINYKQSHETVSFIIWDDKNSLKLVNSFFIWNEIFGRSLRVIITVCDIGCHLLSY